MGIRRREFLISSLGAAAFVQAATKSIWGAAQKPPIGIQLYAVRGEFEKDVPGTLKKLAELGYQGVEFWGYGGTENVFREWTAEALREQLDGNNLKCCGIHMSVKALADENFETTVRNNKILGNKYLIVAAASNLMESPESIKKFANILNESAKKAEKFNMKVGYHCHGFDFKKMNGQTGWDILFSQTIPDVVMQLDTGNCAQGGGDPIAVLKKFPGRADTVHIKEYEGAPLTPTNPEWQKIIQICKKLHNTEWYIIEQGEAKGAGFDVPRESVETLRKML